MLAAEEEYMLAKNWKTTGNIKAAEKLVTSHLRLVAKIAMGYKGYGLPVNEMISEGNVGLMQAVKKFEPEKGFRLATYAMWWIKASIQEYILRSWSLVKIGTTTAQKKLFFNLKKIKNQIAPQSEGDLRDEHVNEIANKLDVSKEEVVSMNRRLSGKEFSLNAQVGEDGDEWQDWLVDKELDHDLKFAHQAEMEQRKDLLKNSIKVLNEREKEILYSRRLNDNPTTLEDLSKKHNLKVRRFHSFLRICYDNLFNDKWDRKIKEMTNMFNSNKPLINQLGLGHLMKVYEISNELFDLKKLEKLNNLSLKYRNKLVK
jgi:RNA polymerase sigma-32 factor